MKTIILRTVCIVVLTSVHASSVYSQLSLSTNPPFLFESELEQYLPDPETTYELLDEAAEETRSVSTIVSGQYASKYFAPIGFALEDNNKAMQGLLVVATENVITNGDGIDFYAWGNAGLNEGPSEIDWGFGYSIPIARGSVRLGFDQFKYPDGKLGETPENMLRISMAQSGIADVSLDSFWRINDGIKKQVFFNLGVSRSYVLAEKESRSISVTPRATAIYNETLWGLTGYAGTMLGITVEYQSGNLAAFADVIQFVKMGEHLLGDRPIKNQSILQTGLRISMPAWEY